MLQTETARLQAVPEYGLTMTAKALKVCATHLSVTLICGTEISVHLTNCFQHERRSIFSLDVDASGSSQEVYERDEDRWSLDEQAVIQTAIAATIERQGVYHVTVPMPPRTSHWWDSLSDKNAPLAAYLWLDDQTTLQQHLIDGGYRSPYPPYPTEQSSLAVHPTRRPFCGLTAPCRIMSGDRSADTWWLQFDPAFEIRARLANCYTDSIDVANAKRSDLAKAAYERAARLVYHYDRQLCCTIPESTGPASWWQELKARSSQTAYLWLTPNRTLNDILVSESLASSTAPRLARAS